MQGLSFRVKVDSLIILEIECRMRVDVSFLSVLIVSYFVHLSNSIVFCSFNFICIFIISYDVELFTRNV